VTARLVLVRHGEIVRPANTSNFDRAPLSERGEIQIRAPAQAALFEGVVARRLGDPATGIRGPRDKGLGGFRVCPSEQGVPRPSRGPRHSMSRGNRSNGRRFDRGGRGTRNPVFPRYRGVEGRASNGGVQGLDRFRVGGDSGSGLRPPTRPGLPDVRRSGILSSRRTQPRRNFGKNPPVRCWYSR